MTRRGGALREHRGVEVCRTPGRCVAMRRPVVRARGSDYNVDPTHTASHARRKAREGSHTAMERTLIILKPDAVQRGLSGEILTRFEKKGLQIVGAKLMRIPQQ